MRVAIDAMGHDSGPAPIIEGAQDFLKDFPDTTVVLVGDQEKIECELELRGLKGHDRIDIVHASQVMEMHEKLANLRDKKDSSIIRLVQAVKEKNADAMVAMGNTAAAVGASTLGLRHLKGVRRSGIAVPLPSRTKSGYCVVIDMGANTNSKPEHLMVYGVMASIYSNKVLHVDNPRVGLLNVGEEKGKGNEVLKETYAQLEKAPINFVGNVEGTDIYNGNCDVIVCDGFVGNAILKASEELATTITMWLKDALHMSWITKLGALLAKKAFKKLKRQCSYDATGGVPLLGVNGICIIGHGRSTPFAVYNGLRVAREAVEVGMNEKISQQLLEYKEKTQ